MTIRTITTTLALSALLSTGCVSKKKYDQLEAAYTASLDEHRSANQDKAALAKDKAKLSNALDDARDTTTALSAENRELEADKAEMQRALTALRKNQVDAEARVAAYRDLMKRFQAMIDAGTLKVTVVDGRMVVQLPTDILFPSGSAELSADGKTQLAEVGRVLGGIDRDFQIEGHTDSDPISTARFPSNWELAAARAITVKNVLRDAGVSEQTLSIAGLADTHPVASNDTPEGKAENRRIEIVLRPDLRLMPGFDQLEAASDAAVMEE